MASASGMAAPGGMAASSHVWQLGSGNSGIKK